MDLLICSPSFRSHSGKFICLLFLLFCLISSHASSEVRVEILASDTRSVTLEFHVTDFHRTDILINDTAYQRIHISDLGLTQTPGKPQVPFRGELLAIPSRANITIELLDAEMEIHQGYFLAPAPTVVLNEDELSTKQTYNADAAIYHADRFWPETPVDIARQGKIREQGVAQLRLFPVLHNPFRGEIQFYNRLRVKVNFGDVSSIPAEHTGAFAPLLKKLLINKVNSEQDRQEGQRRKLMPAAFCPEPEPLAVAVKLLVEEDGMYALNSNDLRSAGLDVDRLDPRQFKMTHQGVEIPILVKGETDSRFDPEDRIVFYAQAMVGLYTRTNVYWLSLNPQGGARILDPPNTVDWENALPLTSYRTTTHVEEDNDYWSYMPNGADQDHWFWVQLNAGESLTIPVTINHLATTSEEAVLRVMLYGKTDDRAQNPDHRTRVLLNDVVVHEALWNGQGTFLHEVKLSQNELVQGTNSLTVESLGNTGAAVDSLFVNYAQIEYRANYNAEADQITFHAQGNGPYIIEVEGFTQPVIEVFDITDPHAVVFPEKRETMPIGSDHYRLIIGHKHAGRRTYLATSLPDNQYLKPKQMFIDSPSVLKSTCYQADYLIIHHDRFDVAELKEMVSARGLAVMAVPISDIYDEFNHGIKDPQAIKDFLDYAYHHFASPRPTYVVLVGDANQDYLNRLGYGEDLVPTYLIQTYLLGDTASDNWFVSVSGQDAFPDLFLGRIPVRSQAQLEAVVAKFKGYQQNVPTDAWNRNVVLVADNEIAFETLSDRLANDYLQKYTTQRVYLSEYSTTAEATSDLIAKLDSGAILTNYVGHGGVSNWAGEFMFDSDDVAILNNPDRLTFVVALNCLNGWFSYYKNNASLAETLLQTPAKGAVAVWAATGLGYTWEHEQVAGELFKDLFVEQQMALGALTTEAKIRAVVNYGVSWDNLETFTLFGEPSMKLQLPCTNNICASVEEETVPPAEGATDLSRPEEVGSTEQQESNKPAEEAISPSPDGGSGAFGGFMLVLILMFLAKVQYHKVKGCDFLYSARQQVLRSIRKIIVKLIL